ncbi:response regulator [Aquincola sp. J276]|uniref:response regulator n=2 Tax=Aquincola TaxID=391952 RepID=UPI0012EE0788|nr:response regulator [Aquincola sp. J276]MCR5864438.1 hypothetical protein [Aquincola sp. J276]
MPWLPRIPKPVPAGLRIALLDPDDLMRALARQWLREAGFRVVDGSALSQPRRPVALVILDCANPRQAEPALRLLQAERPVPVLLMSARLRPGQQHSTALAAQLGVRGVLPKPFTREALLAAVQRALATGTTGD